MRVLGETAQRTARAREEALRAESIRRSMEQNLRALSATEQVRLGQGLARVADLQAAGEWQKAANLELAAKAEGERQARDVHAAKTAAESSARRELAIASNQAKTIDAHRDAFRAQRAAAQELYEEEVAAEQWTASHFPSRRS